MDDFRRAFAFCVLGIQIMRTLPSSLICLASAFTIAAPAWSTSYVVNQSIGASGAVTGTIDTDGTIGTLSGADFTAWNLLLTGAGASFVLTNLNSNVYLTGTGTTATATDISFDFSGASAGTLLFQAGGYGSGNTYWCNASAAGACRQGTTVAPESYFSPSFQTEARTGDQIIAGNAVAAVPEPASWAMMLGGFGAIGGAMRSRRKANVSFG